MTAYHSLRHRSLTHLTRHFSTATKTKTQIPTLYSPNDAAPTTALQLLSWGRGASGQLGGGIEEIRLYPSPVANLAVPSSSFTLSPTPGKLPTPKAGNDVMEVGISCGLFHSSLLVDGKVWIWGKGDGGRLGFGHENSAFLPTLNPYLDSIRCVSLGGLHSVSLTTLGEVYTWSVQ